MAGEWCLSDQVEIIQLIPTEMEYNFSTSEPFGPDLSFVKSTRDRICRDLLARDPYEVRMVVVGHSGEREGGEGLFAARDLPANTVAAFYNGVRLAGCDLQGWEEEEEEADCDYRIYVNMINLQEVQ